MRHIYHHALQLLIVPVVFTRDTLKGFEKNQGLLLAGAIAYYMLLSLVPLLALSVSLLSHIVERAELLDTLHNYLEWLVPSQAQALLVEVSEFLDSGVAIGAVLLLTMLFFSSLAFSVLQKALAVIFAHRHATRKRHPFVTAILPYGFVLCLGIALLAVTLLSVTLQTLASESIHFLRWEWSLRGLSGALLYLLGLSMEMAMIAAIYLVMPIGRTRLSHALIGGVTVTAIWEIIRHVLVWYFTTLSKASVVYGSLSTVVVALFSIELAATLLLFGAQVISEYERLEHK